MHSLHINDPKYIEQIFGGPGKRRNKGQMTIHGLETSPTVMGTQKHDLHRSRRAAQSPFSLKQSIRHLEPTVVQVVHRLLSNCTTTLLRLLTNSSQIHIYHKSSESSFRLLFLSITYLFLLKSRICHTSLPLSKKAFHCILGQHIDMTV
jgi:hypothetical protein